MSGVAEITSTCVVSIYFLAYLKSPLKPEENSIISFTDGETQARSGEVTGQT